jgi:protein-tyrosine phosphatase
MSRLFLAVVLPCVCLPARGDDPEPPAGRHVALEGQPNFRDIGGYKTSDGKTVKSGQVYRSGELPRLTDDDVSKLQELGIKTVVNFLTDVESEARGRDRLPKGVKEISLPIKVGDDLAKLGLEARQSGDFSKLPPEMNPKVHQVLTAEATAEYAAFLREVAKPENRPLVFHCSHGVHRTGTGTAILLWTLGVPWETVRKDYLLSNKYRRAEIDERLAQLRQLAAKKQNVPPEKVDMTNINAFYILQGDYIDATRDEILKSYGSIEAYLTKGLGLKSRDIQNLRDRLLE